MVLWSRAGLKMRDKLVRGRIDDVYVASSDSLPPPQLRHKGRDAAQRGHVTELISPRRANE